MQQQIWSLSSHARPKIAFGCASIGMDHAAKNVNPRVREKSPPESVESRPRLRALLQLSAIVSFELSAASSTASPWPPPHWVQVQSLLPHLLPHLISLQLLLPIHFFFVSRVLDGDGSQPTSVMALVPPGTSVLLPLPHLLQTFFLHLVKPLFLC